MTINSTDIQHVFGATIVDAAGHAIPGLSGYAFTWASDDNGSVVAAMSANGSAVSMRLTGAVGSFNLTCTAARGGSPTLQGTLPITVQGPVPDHLVLALVS
jgi:hypothetical protein